MADSGLGMGIALQGTPRRAIDFAYSEARTRAAEARAAKASAAREDAANKKALYKIREKDFKIDPKLYHRKVMPVVTKKAKETFDQILDSYRKDPHNWQNNVQQKLLDFNSELAKYRQQSDAFFNYEKQDRTKFNVDDRVIKALGENFGDFRDLEEITGKSRGMKGYQIGNDGFWSFSPIPKVDRFAEYQAFSKDEANYNEKSAGATKTGIPGVMDITTKNIPIDERVNALKENMGQDPMVLAQILFDTPEDEIPEDVSLENPASVAKFGRAKLDEEVSKAVTPYIRKTPHNIPKEEGSDKDEENSKPKWIKKDGGWGLQVGNNIWTTKYDPSTKKYMIKVSAIKTGTGTETPSTDWVYDENGGKGTTTGDLVGFYYDAGTNSLRTSITYNEPVQPDAEADQRKPGEPPSTTESSTDKGPKYVRKYKDIGYSTETRQYILNKHGMAPWDAAKALIERNYGKKLPKIVNDPSQKTFDWGADDQEQPAQPRTMKQVGDSLKNSGYWDQVD